MAAEEEGAAHIERLANNTQKMLEDDLRNYNFIRLVWYWEWGLS
jgi:hypothetical protein